VDGDPIIAWLTFLLVVYYLACALRLFRAPAWSAGILALIVLTKGGQTPLRDDAGWNMAIALGVLSAMGASFVTHAALRNVDRFKLSCVVAVALQLCLFCLIIGAENWQPLEWQPYHWVTWSPNAARGFGALAGVLAVLGFALGAHREHRAAWTKKLYRVCVSLLLLFLLGAVWALLWEVLPVYLGFFWPVLGVTAFATAMQLAAALRERIASDAEPWGGHARRASPLGRAVRDRWGRG